MLNKSTPFNLMMLFATRYRQRHCIIHRAPYRTCVYRNMISKRKKQLYMRSVRRCTRTLSSGDQTQFFYVTVTKVYLLWILWIEINEMPVCDRDLKKKNKNKKSTIPLFQLAPAYWLTMVRPNYIKKKVKLGVSIWKWVLVSKLEENTDNTVWR